MRNYYLGRWSGNSYNKAAYEIGMNKGGWDKEMGFENVLIDFCPELFEALTNVRLKPGAIRKIKSIRFVLEDVK